MYEDLPLGSIIISLEVNPLFNHLPPQLIQEEIL